jgi:cysteine desulfuration protein SufE
MANLDLQQIRDDLAFLDDWEDRYRYIIDLGKTLEPLSDAEYTEENKVRGCASQVWLVHRAEREGDSQPRLLYRGDSDAHIVKGLVALVLALFSGKTADAILSTDAQAFFAQIGLKSHLTQQRSNGLASMVETIKADARRLAG